MIREVEQIRQSKISFSAAFSDATLFHFTVKDWFCAIIDAGLAKLATKPVFAKMKDAWKGLDANKTL